MYTYVRTYIHTYVHTYIHPSIHPSIHPYIHTYIHMYIYTSICRWYMYNTYRHARYTSTTPRCWRMSGSVAPSPPRTRVASAGSAWRSWTSTRTCWRSDLVELVQLIFGIFLGWVGLIFVGWFLWELVGWLCGIICWQPKLFFSFGWLYLTW